ncbi:MAG: tetratricopeptide repeat protein [Phycisphaerae bacterium]|nr:tetratricopeptide repeat protein [Phycisphaerae bacterium]
MAPAFADAPRSRRTRQQVFCAVLLVHLIFPGLIHAQTSQPADGSIDHDALVARSKQDPLYIPPLIGRSGKKLTEPETARIDESRLQFDDAMKARNRGEFAAGIAPAESAHKTREALLGPKHHLSISASNLLKSLQFRSVLPKEKQDALRAADAALADAERLQAAGDYAKAVAAAKTALQTYEVTLAESDPDRGLALVAIGAAQVDLGWFDEAELALGRAQSNLESELGPDHPLLARVHDRLGWLKIYQSGNEGFVGPKARSAVDHFRRAIQILLKSVGETLEMAESLDNRGTIQVYLGNEKEALNDKIRAYVIRETLQGPNGRETGVSVSNLAWLYERLGQDRYVIPFRRHALEIFSTQLSEEHPFTFIEKGNLARAYVKAGKLDDGIRLITEMRQLDAKQNDPLDIGAVDRTVELAGMVLRTGRGSDAIKLLDEAMGRCEQIRERARKQDATNILARVFKLCQANRMFVDGARYCAKLVAWDDEDRERTDTLELAGRAASLGALQLQAGKTDDAKRTLTSAINRISKLTSDRSIEMGPPLLNLAFAYSISGELDKAEKNCEKVLALSEELFGSESLGTALAMMWLGRVQTLQKRYSDAEFHLSESQNIYSKYIDDDPTGVIRVLVERAKCSAAQGRNDEALALLKDALTQCRKWASGDVGPFTRANQLEILKYLIEYSSDSSSAEVKSERDMWIADFQKIFAELERLRALSTDEQEWPRIIEK